MINYVKSGNTISAVAPVGGVASGDFVLIGALFGVAAAAAAAGAAVELVTEGVFTLPKATGTAWLQGDQLFWDTSAKNFTKDSTKRAIAVIAAADAASGDATGDVKVGADLANLRTVCGQQTTVTAADTVATGLTKVLSVTATFETDPADANDFVSAQVGDQAGAPAAGSIVIKTWKSGDGADVTPVAASSFGKKVNWIAVGI